MPDQKWMSVHGCNYNWYMLRLEKRISLFYINQLTRWHFTRINVLWVIVFHKSCLCSAKEPLDSFQPSGSWWHLRSHNSAWLYENNYSRIKVIKVLNILHAAGGGMFRNFKKKKYLSVNKKSLWYQRNLPSFLVSFGFLESHWCSSNGLWRLLFSKFIIVEELIT